MLSDLTVSGTGTITAPTNTDGSGDVTLGNLTVNGFGTITAPVVDGGEGTDTSGETGSRNPKSSFFTNKSSDAPAADEIDQDYGDQ